ncbi:MAG TPA: AMP-binding protein, partial [Microthrixaceae bacterium]|nr:AMP-binding protein [Microthrixaceae bacterium]
MAYNIADLFEHTVDAVPDRMALIDGDTRLTFAELDERSNRVAHALIDRGVKPGDHVGIYAQNCHEWLETMFGAFKARAIPININFRYVEDELAYLIGNADCVAVVFGREYADRLAAVRDRTETLHTFLWINDGSDADLAGLPAESYDEAIATASPERDFDERSPDDLYVLYTGGTTGLPKGVMWRQEDVFMALGQGIDSVTGERVTSDRTLAEKAAAGGGLLFLIIPPLMHGAAQWGTMGQMFQGNTIVLLPKFSAEAVWDVVARERVN